jgi:SAM-dependent methyltransferase
MVVVMQNGIAQGRPEQGSSGAWARLFSLLYDPFLSVGERAGLRTQRKELLGAARGYTLEVGCGTGLNLAHYPADLDELVLVEPDPSMRYRLEKRLRRSRRRPRVVEAPVERLPVADGSVDTVVSTLVLCTVDAPDLALAEIARVLRPDGRLLFIEHVRSESPGLARWQDRLAGPWRIFAQGCRCNRATVALITTCGFEVERQRQAAWRAMPPIVRPLVVGQARKESKHG